jgi:hypothetical protein
MARLQSDANESNVPNREELLNMAIRAAKDGNREGARVMLRKVLSEDRRNERAMMWMAKLAGNRNERQQWLARVLSINPNNQAARDSLRKMNYKTNARDNKVLLVFGVVAGVLMILGVVILLVATSAR